VAGFCECSKESSGSIHDGLSVGQLSKYQLPNEDSVPLR
jgi:hypothetical protein